MSMPLRPGRDVLSLLHRDLGAHLLLGSTPYQLLCQYLANADSPTHACEGNVHHGDAASRRFPMISHLGKMLSVVVGGTWAARRNGEQVFGLAVIGDGGTSTGEFHESLNIASVHKVPVLFLIENNHYAFSTPTSVQYNCRRLSDRAIGYGISGRTIDGTDPWTVYSTVCEAIDAMEESSSARLAGVRHASLVRSCRLRQGPLRSGRIDGAMAEGRSRPPHATSPGRSLRPCTNHRLPRIEEAVETEIREAVARALAVGRPRPPQQWPVHAEAATWPTTAAAAIDRDSSRRLGLPSARSLRLLKRPAAGAEGRTARGLCLLLCRAVKPVPGEGGQERRRRQHGPRLSAGEPADGVPRRHGRGRLRFGIQDLQGPGRSLRGRPRDRHAAGRVEHHGLRAGCLADRGRADHRIPVRRFLDRSRDATRPERRHLVLPHRLCGADARAAALRRRHDGRARSTRASSKGCGPAFPG